MSGTRLWGCRVNSPSEICGNFKFKVKAATPHPNAPPYSRSLQMPRPLPPPPRRRVNHWRPLPANHQAICFFCCRTPHVELRGGVEGLTRTMSVCRDHVQTFRDRFVGAPLLAFSWDVGATPLVNGWQDADVAKL